MKDPNDLPKDSRLAYERLEPTDKDKINDAFYKHTKKVLFSRMFSGKLRLWFCSSRKRERDRKREEWRDRKRERSGARAGRNREQGETRTKIHKQNPARERKERRHECIHEFKVKVITKHPSKLKGEPIYILMNHLKKTAKLAY